MSAIGEHFRLLARALDVWSATLLGMATWTAAGAATAYLHGAAATNPGATGVALGTSITAGISTRLLRLPLAEPARAYPRSGTTQVWAMFGAFSLLSLVAALVLAAAAGAPAAGMAVAIWAGFTGLGIVGALTFGGWLASTAPLLWLFAAMLVSSQSSETGWWAWFHYEIAPSTAWAGASVMVAAAAVTVCVRRLPPVNLED